MLGHLTKEGNLSIYTHLKEINVTKLIRMALVIVFSRAFLSQANAQSYPLQKKNLIIDSQQTETSSATADNSSDRNIPGSNINAHSFGIGLGETFLAGNFRKHGEDSITFDGYYDYSASYTFDLLVNAHYSKHSNQEEYVTTQGAVLSIKTKLYQFDAFSPFVLGGLGFYRPKVKRYISPNSSDKTLIESEGKTAFGMNLGLGADLKLNNLFSVGVIGHYHNPFDIKQNNGPDVEGSYFKLLLTLMYYL